MIKRLNIKINSTTKLILLLVLVAIVFVKCMDNTANKTIATVGFNDFAGSEACQSCHQDIFKTHTQTAHFLSLRKATAENIMGSFETGKKPGVVIIENVTGENNLTKALSRSII